MISVIATITTREGGVAALLEHINDNLSNVRAESGCIEYLPMLDAESGMAAQVKDANVVIMLEKWETMEHCTTTRWHRICSIIERKSKTLSRASH